MKTLQIKILLAALTCAGIAATHGAAQQPSWPADVPGFVKPQPPELEAAEGNAEQGRDRVQVLLPALEQEIHQQDAAGEEGQLELRHDGPEVFGLEELRPHYG